MVRVITFVHTGSEQQSSILSLRNSSSILSFTRQLYKMCRVQTFLPTWTNAITWRVFYRGREKALVLQRRTINS